MGQVQEITQIQSLPGKTVEYLRTMQFDSHGNMMEASEGSQEIGTTDVKWQSKILYTYDASRRLSSITEFILLDPVVQSECVFGYSETGDLSIVLLSDEKRFVRASLYAYSQGRRIKELDYFGRIVRPTISIFEYDDRGIKTVKQTGGLKNLYNERGEHTTSKLYEDGKLIAYETLVYNERGDLTEYAHYRSNDRLVWRDLWRYEYDKAGNWTSREYSKTGEEAGKSPEILNLTKRSITYYNALPPQ